MASRITLAIGLFVLHASAPGQRAVLEARFIGNMAFAISDGATTVMTDFPYQSGYSGYMAYDPAEIRSSTPATLSLVTHRHSDHWDPALSAKTPWRVAGPDDVIKDVAPARVLAFGPAATFVAIQIERIETPHARVGHHSYVLTWHDRRLYFSGDTEDTGHLLRLTNLDAAFVSPWLFKSVQSAGARIDARQVVIYHHQAGEKVPQCAAGCTVPRQGQTLAIR